MRIDPPVSVPIAPRHISATTAAAEPPLEPPGMRVVSHGIARRRSIRAIRELVRVRLADDDSPGLMQLLDNSGIFGAAI